MRLAAEERFYFPWQVDHRGRTYPVPQLMNPQCDHIGRALIEFADGKPLGHNRGVYWLAIHLANCYWKKKVSFKKRRAWVQENEKEILDFAANPLRLHRFWTEADQPWLFLAACLEWKRYKEEVPACSRICRSVWTAHATAISISARWGWIRSAAARRI